MIKNYENVIPKYELEIEQIDENFINKNNLLDEMTQNIEDVL